MDYVYDCWLVEENFPMLEDGEMYDSWNIAQLVSENIGCEYNLCIDNSTNEMINESAIYFMYRDEGKYLWDTDFSKFVHYEIDLNNENWQLDLESAMFAALQEWRN